jgi:P27 family predicted phage terminase small subunit
MGQRGPLAKPTQLKVLQGNPGKRALNLSDGVNPRVEIPSAPRHLTKEAAKEWKRITPILEELGLISGLDRAALALYCQSVGRLTELETAFNARVKGKVDGGLDYAEAVFEVSQALTPNGYAQQSVIVQLIRNARHEVHKYLMHFGLSPAARARVQPSNYVDPTLPLPGMEPQGGAGQQGFAKFAVVGGGG